MAKTGNLIFSLQYMLRKKNGIKNIGKSKEGFSLIEIMVAMSILTLILGGITLFSVRTIQAHTRSQAMQSALENARFAIESISKMARTSELTEIKPDKSSITFTSNDESIGSVTYAFNNGKLTYNNVPLVGGDKITVTGNFDGSFKGSSTQRGFVAIFITITYNTDGSPSEKDSLTIRSAVSTRY